jgi:hypothetical protein
VGFTSSKAKMRFTQKAQSGKDRKGSGRAIPQCLAVLKVNSLPARGGWPNSFLYQTSGILLCVLPERRQGGSSRLEPGVCQARHTDYNLGVRFNGNRRSFDWRPHGRCREPGLSHSDWFGNSLCRPSVQRVRPDSRSTDRSARRVGPHAECAY